MNYIVVDLEWNQSPIGHAGEHPRMPFEIIEIGAVKLDEKYNIIEEFQRLVKPRLYPTLHKYIKNILNYDEKELRKNGVDFKKACTEFLRWCSLTEDGITDFVFCTWGPSDLSYLQNNMDFYKMEKLEYPLKFYDIQQIYAEKYSKEGNVCKLEKAVDRLRLVMDRPFHSAVNDAYYTARVLQKGRLGNIEDKYSIDLYRHPKTNDDRVVEYHNKVLDYISGEYESKRMAMQDPEILAVKCSRCGRKTTKRVDWFQNSSGTELSVGKCFRHGNMLASLKFRPAADSSSDIFVIKRIVPISNAKYKELKSKSEAIEKKKREKRLSN